MPTKLDGKFHGIIVKNKDQSIVPQDQWICFLAKDNAVLETLAFYYNQCKRLGAHPRQLEAVGQMMARVDQLRRNNPGICKVPDVEPGEITI